MPYKLLRVTNHSRILQYRKISLVAIVIMLASQLLMVVRWANGIQAVEVYYCFPWAVGCGMLFTAQFVALTICSPKEQMASATAAYYLSQQVGQIIGTSVSAMALQHLFRFRLDIWLGDIPLSKRIQVFLVSNVIDLKYTNSIVRSSTRSSKTTVSLYNCHRPSKQRCNPATSRHIDYFQVCQIIIVITT